MEKMAAVLPSDDEYLKMSVLELAKNRIPWANQRPQRHNADQFSPCVYYIAGIYRFLIHTRLLDDFGYAERVCRGAVSDAAELCCNTFQLYDDYYRHRGECRFTGLGNDYPRYGSGGDTAAGYDEGRE